jgi:hypothetical protein
MNEALLKVPMEEEVGIALSQMAPMKSPGPDGLPVGFYVHRQLVCSWERGM